MPVLAPLGDFAGVDRALVITAGSAAAGWLRLVAPAKPFWSPALRSPALATTSTCDLYRLMGFCSS